MAFPPFAIGQRLTAADLNAAVGAVWNAYTPTWITTGAGADPGLSNGTMIGRWRKVGSTVTVKIYLSWGSLTTGGSGDWEFGLPAGEVPAATGQQKAGQCFILDAGFQYFNDIALIVSGGTTIRCIPHANGGYYNATNRMTWATNDTLNIELDYETA